MKIYISKDQPSNELGYTWVSSIRTLDAMVQDSEATSIIVDDFLSSVRIEETGNLLLGIVKKMRIGSEIIFYQRDIDLICHEYARGSFNLEEFNRLVFSGDRVNSVFNLDILCNSLKTLNLNIESKQLNHKNFQGVVKARRVKNGN